MHDESPSGLAIKDRTLALWREIGKIELPGQQRETKRKITLWHIIALIFLGTIGD